MLFETNYNQLCFQTDCISSLEECNHNNLESMDGGKVCIDCGYFLHHLDYTFDKNEEGSRCQFKTSTLRSVDDVFIKNNIDIPDINLDVIDKKYKLIVKKDKVRGKSRDSLVGICFLFSLREKQDYKTLDDMSRMFKVSRKDLSASLAKYYKIFIEERTKYIHAEDLIIRTLLLLEEDISHKDVLIKLCQLIKNKSKLLNRSTPQAVAAAIAFIYFRNKYEKEEKYFDKKLFAKKMFLSEITINKNVKEIEKLFFN